MRAFRPLAVLLAGLTATPVFGGSLQVFGGYADTRSADLDVELRYYVPPLSASEPVDGESPSFGARVLFPIAPYPAWSIGLDLSQFEASSDTVGIDAWPLTMHLRYTFRGVPAEPYLGLGYSLTYVDVDVSADSSLGVAASESSFGAGPAAMAGLSFALGEASSLFLEYRHDWTRVDFETESVPLFAPAEVTSRYSVNLDTDRILLGLSYDF